MDCLRTRELLNLLVDRELPLDLSGSVLSHLESCAPCRAESEGLRSLGRLLHELKQTAPPGLAAKILSQARACPPPPRIVAGGIASLWPRAAAALLGAAAAALILPRLMPAAATSGELRSPFQVVVSESQADLELGGSFRRDVSALTSLPAGRLIHQLSGGR